MGPLIPIDKVDNLLREENYNKIYIYEFDDKAPKDYNEFNFTIRGNSHIGETRVGM